jgi:two-component system, response regulator PdtaR
MNSARVLIVEDEFIIAEEIAAIVSDAGYSVLGPVGTIDAAEQALATADDKPDFAIVDANLRGGSSAPIAARLRALSVPFCVCTGYRFNDLKSTFGDVALLQKPVDRRSLVAVIRAALSPPPSTTGTHAV